MEGCATLGALVVPISFLIVWEMTFSLRAATLAASLILFGESLSVENVISYRHGVVIVQTTES